MHTFVSKFPLQSYNHVKKSALTFHNWVDQVIAVGFGGGVACCRRPGNETRRARLKIYVCKWKLQRLRPLASMSRCKKTKLATRETVFQKDIHCVTIAKYNIIPVHLG